MKTPISFPLLEIQFCPPLASPEFYEMLLQFTLNIATLLVISRALYYRWNHKPEYMFTQIITGVIVFLICAMLRWVQLGMGLVLGLFAIFAIIRFRTLNVPVKEMAYLFMVVGISSVNALLRASECLQWIVFANLFLVILTYIMEKTLFSKSLNRRTIIYNHTDLLKPSQHELLLKELRELTELNIVRVEIGKVDYVKSHAQLRLYYLGDNGEDFQENENGNDDD